MREITVPETKPATEWVRGRALQKVSPQERHARIQARLSSLLLAWTDATHCGRIGTEWDFRVTPPGEPTRPLVPDIAFLSYTRLSQDNVEAAQIPRMAPDVAVEIISPGDRRADIDDKIAVYLASGCRLVLLVDPRTGTFEAHDAQGVTHYSSGETFTHPALPGFTTAVDAVFS